MNNPHLPFPIQSDAPAGDQVKPGFGTKTVATRLTPGELGEVEAAAESGGQSLAEWLRETALHAARQRPGDPIELLLGEIWALRYTLLNLFYENAKAASDGIRMLPDSIAKIRDHADELKLPKARRILEDFVSRNGSQRSQK
jgi:hypothetical protein